MRSLQSFLPLKISSRASLTQPGQSESVWRGHPSVGLVFSQDFNKGLSDHFGVKEGLGWYLLKNWIVSDRKSTRLNSSHVRISYAVFCLKKKKKNYDTLVYGAYHHSVDAAAADSEDTHNCSQVT